MMLLPLGGKRLLGAVAGLKSSKIRL